MDVSNGSVNIIQLAWRLEATFPAIKSRKVIRNAVSSHANPFSFLHIKIIIFPDVVKFALLKLPKYGRCRESISLRYILQPQEFYQVRSNQHLHPSSIQLPYGRPRSHLQPILIITQSSLLMLGYSVL